MREYPSVLKEIQYGEYIYAFDKLDGSQIRAEWDSKKGFHKFGSRKQLIDKTHLFLSESIDLINEKYDEIRLSCKRMKTSSAICFFEFFGNNSFAGQHVDEPHRVILFDIVIGNKSGFLEPREFIKYFSNVGIPKMLYHDICNFEFVDSVKNSTLDDMTFEGVMCKYTKKKSVAMFKIKSEAWLLKLHNYCGDNISLFKELE